MMKRAIVTAALIAAQPAAASHRKPPPEGVTIPPPVQLPTRPPARAALAIRGFAKSSIGANSLPLTSEYETYAAKRFADWPHPLEAGLWDYTVFRVQVAEVLRADEAHSNIRPGAVIDVYIADGMGLNTNPELGSTAIALFLESYAHPEGGVVSPHSQAGNAFVLPASDPSDAVLMPAPRSSSCPGRALTEAERLVLHLAPTYTELAAMRARVPSVKPTPNGNIHSPLLSVAQPGGPATVYESAVGDGPWSCEDFVRFDELQQHMVAK